MRFWAAARKGLGDGAGTRALIEVLLLGGRAGLNRHHVQSCLMLAGPATVAFRVAKAG